MFNDGLGGGSNGSFKGAPGPDSDILRQHQLAIAGMMGSRLKEAAAIACLE